MSDMKRLLEKMTQFAGQAVGQKPGDQVRGTEKATKRKDNKHPFAGRLVGASEDKSLLADLEKELVEGAVKRSLAEEFAAFKESRVAYDKKTGQMGVDNTDTDQRHGLYINSKLVKTVDGADAANNLKKRDPRFKDATVKKIAEGLTPAGEFLSKEERVKAGDKVYYKGKCVGIATGDMDDRRVVFKPVAGYGTNPNFASLPVDLISLRESTQFSELELAIMEGGNSLDEADDMFADRNTQKIGMAIINAGKGMIEDAPHRWEGDEEMIEYTLKDGRDLINVGNAYLEQGIEAGNTAFWDLDTAVRDEAYDAVLKDAGIDMNDILNLDEGTVIAFPKRKKLPQAAKSGPTEPKTNNVKVISKDRYAKTGPRTMQGPTMHSVYESNRLMHSDATVNVFYKPGHNQTKAQMVARMVPNSQVDRIIASLVDKFKVKPTDFEWQPSDRDQYKFTNEDSEDFGYKSLHPEIFKARQQFPMAKSDMEALLMYVQSQEEQDIKRVDRVNDREDAEIEQLNKEENSLERRLETLSAQLEKLKAQAKTVKEEVPAPVATAGGPAGANQPKTPPGVTPQVDPAQQALLKQNQSKMQQNLANLKSAGVQIDPAKAAQTLQKTDTGAPMNAMDKDNIAAMAPAIGNVMANPQTATQLNTLIKKAGGGV